MTWSYDPHQSTLRDRVRAYVRDTDGEQPLRSDEAVDVLIGALGEHRAKAELCRQLASEFGTARPYSSPVNGPASSPTTDQTNRGPGTTGDPRVAVWKYLAESAQAIAETEEKRLADAAVGGLQSMRPVRSDLGPLHGEYVREPGDFGSGRR